MFGAIALGGGGVRGFLLVGALQELARRQPLEFPRGIWGISVGSILATAIAYRIPPTTLESLFLNVSIDDIAPAVRLSHLLEAPKLKGIYPMDTLEKAVLSAFETQGIDLSSATIADAPQPLHIVASNLTRCTPTVFAGKVRILDAIKASCALPLFFQPQVIYDSIYVDGGLFVPSIEEIVPKEAEALILNLSRPHRGIQPSDLATLTPWEYVERLHHSGVEYRLKTTLGRNSVWLKNASVSTMSRLTPEQRSELVASGASQLVAFWAQRLDKPSADAVGTDGGVVVDDLVGGLKHQ